MTARRIARAVAVIALVLLAFAAAFNVVADRLSAQLDEVDLTYEEWRGL